MDCVKQLLWFWSEVKIRDHEMLIDFSEFELQNG